MSSKGKNTNKGTKPKGGRGFFGFGKSKEEKQKNSPSDKSSDGATKVEKPRPKEDQKKGPRTKPVGQKSGNQQSDRKGTLTKNSQVRTSDSALLQFGPIVSEFLLSDNLGKKKITAEYDHDTNSWNKVTFTFSTLNEGEISFENSVSLEKDEYITKRVSLIGGSESNPRWLSFVASLIRIKIDITDTHPQVDIKKVFSFIRENMSPIENVVVGLPQREYDTVDVQKLAPVLSSELKKFEGHYQNIGRIAYIKGAINGTGKILEKIDWNQYSMAPYNKASVLNNFRVKNDIDNDVMSRIQQFSDTLNGVVEGGVNLGEE